METSTQQNSTAAATRTFEKGTRTQRNDTTRRIESEVYAICKWDDPARSAVVLASLIGSIVLTKNYSLFQIITGLLTIAISINLVYVLGTQFTQTMVAGRPSTHPWSKVLSNKDTNLLNKDSAAHYSSIVVDLAETLTRALTRIVLIEDRNTSLKWLGIFFTAWRISAYVPSRILVSIFIVSAFVFPRLYISNKDVIDARLHQGQALLNAQLQRTQEFASTQITAAKQATQSFVEKKSSTSEANTATTIDPVQKVD